MSDDSWADPDRADGDDHGEDGDDHGVDPASEPTTSHSGSLGPPSTSLPNVPDRTPPSGTPRFPDDATVVLPGGVNTPVAGTPRPGSEPGSDLADGTAVMPSTPGALGAAHVTAGPGAPPPRDPIVATDRPARPSYVIAEDVPWYRVPEKRAAATIGALAAIIVIGLGAWLLTRGGDGDDVLVTDESTTTFETTTTTLDPALIPTPETTIVDTSTTEAIVEETSTTVVETTTTVLETTTTAEPTTTTTTIAPTTTETATTPPTAPVTIQSIIQANPELARFDALVESAGFYPELNAINDPVTLFVPNNDAIDEVQADIPTDREALRRLLRGHFSFDGRLNSADLFGRTSVKDANGEILEIDATTQTIGGAKLAVANTPGANPNQILHVVDKVLVSG